MIRHKITRSFGKIEVSRQSGYILEALLMNYHLNVDLMKLLLLSVKPGYSFDDRKFKEIIKDFNDEISVNPKLKSIINKKAFRLVKTWLLKMEGFFKQLRYGPPPNTRLLQVEAEKIFNVLNISANKLFVRIETAR